MRCEKRQLDVRALMEEVAMAEANGGERVAQSRANYFGVLWEFIVEPAIRVRSSSTSTLRANVSDLGCAFFELIIICLGLHSRTGSRLKLSSNSMTSTCATE